MSNSLPTPATIRIIREEHSRLGAVIHGMLVLIRQLKDAAGPPDLKPLRAMMFYISEYPEQQHHPKEDSLLFEPLRRHGGELGATLDELEEQHHQGEALVHQMEHLLIRYEFLGQPAYPALLDAMTRYADFYFRHMRVEEEIVLPAAQRLLTPQEWAVTDSEFAANRDPLEGSRPGDDFGKLFSLIVNIAPAPVGLGDAMR